MVEIFCGFENGTSNLLVSKLCHSIVVTCTANFSCLPTELPYIIHRTSNTQ
jgi:hypothetical protein